MNNEMIALRNINPGVGNTNMAKEKYEIYRQAILQALDGKQDGLELKALSAEVEKHLPPDKRDMLGKVTWHTMAVKLDLEARQEIERIPKSKPQRLRLKV